MNSKIGPSRTEILAEIGHLHLIQESHNDAARLCQKRIDLLRIQLEQTEQKPPSES